MLSALYKYPKLRKNRFMALPFTMMISMGIRKERCSLETERIAFLTGIYQSEQGTMEKAVPVVATTATAPLVPICTVTVKDAVEAFL